MYPAALLLSATLLLSEILRLRLSLASYKVRTGQTCVPLADLVVKPLPLTGPLPGKSISNDDGGGDDDDDDGQQPDAGADNDVGDGPMDRQPCAERELSD
ncbi:hypothetical protein GMORB2_2081 [Geosmithia morbida]|uniref:Secreted protein n=1 Tax=Geosmithia morbida TaxID=1094350 RepID=A0A9P4YSS2_9HYPO|nr:uncharacterized protein GMORB2_2081 [Geosmithia morbida]KAF4121119.1 hypothetical protein GMORB2_2081 [Geosmithia morbida]